jgi:hypothetical protein
MVSTDQNLQIDGSYKAVTSNESFVLSSEWTFVTNLTGDQGSHTLFTVTGDVLVTVFGVCTVNMAGSGADFEVGVTGNTAGIIAQIADVEDLDAGEIYIDATPEVGTAAVPSPFIINGGLDVLLKITNADVSAGVVTFYCLWRPLSSGSSVTVTTPA